MAKGFLYDEGDALITRTEDVLPDTDDASAGDVLSLDSNKKPKWSTPESELPGTGTASAGDVLTLDEDKEPVWSAPSGGGGGATSIKYEANPADHNLRFFRSDDSEQTTPLALSDLIELGYTLAFGPIGSTPLLVEEEDGVYYLTGVYFAPVLTDPTDAKILVYVSDSNGYNDLTATAFNIVSQGYIALNQVN